MSEKKRVDPSVCVVSYGRFTVNLHGIFDLDDLNRIIATVKANSEAAKKEPTDE